MRLRILLKRVLLISVLSGFGISLVFIPNVIYGEVTQNSIDSSAPPIHLKIPEINVDASIESVGLTKEGAVDAPKGPVNAAWFDLSPRPGEPGNSIIDGHFGWKDGKQAVFDNLNTLKKGDKLYVEDANGVTTTFIVREVRIYGEKEDAFDVFVSKDEKSHLNLITCGGVWNEAEKSYSDRLVVFADKE